MSLHRFTASAALLLLFASYQSLHASTMTGDVSACPTATLLAYEQNDSQCSIGILLFSGFNFASSGVGSPMLDSAADILLTPAADGFSFSQTNGQPFSVLQGQIALYTIGYNFFIDPIPVLGGAGLTLDPPFGDVTVTQAYCNDGSFVSSESTGAAGPLCTNGTSIFAPQTLRVHNPDKLTDSITFNPPAFIDGSVLTTLILNGSLAPAGFDSVTGTATTAVLPDAPEPATVLMAFGGLIITGVWSRRRRA